jgi:hypothetical protein
MDSNGLKNGLETNSYQIRVRFASGQKMDFEADSYQGTPLGVPTRNEILQAASAAARICIAEAMP